MMTNDEVVRLVERTLQELNKKGFVSDFCKLIIMKDIKIALRKNAEQMLTDFSNQLHVTYSEDGKVAFFNGHKFTSRSSSSRYYRNQELHVEVYETLTGDKVQPGEVVHHIDCNPLNNDVSNLQRMKLRDHLRLHNKNYQRFGIKRQCEFCGKTFVKRTTHQLYCCKSCGEKARRRKVRNT